MSDPQHPVRVPLINANEDELEVTEIFVEEGVFVRAGAPLCVVESTKATSDVEAPVSGYVRELRVARGRRARVGALICVLTASADEPVSLGEGERAVEGGGAFEVTRKAQELAEARGVDLAGLGLSGIVRVKDVERALAARHQPALGAESRRGAVGAEGLRGVVGDRVVILGAGGHARALIDVIRAGRRDLRIVGAVDDSPGALTDVLGVPVLGPSSRLEALRAEGVAFAGLGVGAVTNNPLRVTLYERLKALGFDVPSFIHPSAVVEASATMGQGNQLFPGAIVGSNVRLGDNTIINSGVVLSHDCVIGSHAHITPGAILAGNVTVGPGAVVGMGVTVYLGVTIGAGALIANGCHIMHDIPDGAVVRASQ